jgi:hypothetical protein
MTMTKRLHLDFSITSASVAMLLSVGLAHATEPLKAAPTNNPTPTPAITAGAGTVFCPSSDPRCPPSEQIGRLPPPTPDRAAPKKSVERIAQVPQCTTVRRDLANKTNLPSLDINTAPRENLIKAPGISAQAAQQIISERSKAQFTDWDDLLQRADGMRCNDFTGSALRIGPNGYGRGVDPKSPGW